MNWNYITNYPTNYPKTCLFFLLLLLTLFKLPAIGFDDIQPWDEGMYAARVNSIYLNGDFWDQAQHSVAGMDSGSQPPLVVWLGYFATKAFGLHDWILKLIPFIFGLLSVIVITMLGKELFDFKTGFLSAVIFSSSVLFSIYIKRFQLDIPVLFFILLPFYFIVKFLKTSEYEHTFFAGICFGLSLMTKLLVGFIVPLILICFLVTLFFHKNNLNRKKIFTGILILSFTGLLIALPWHYHVLEKYGGSFIQYIFGFHIYQRAVEGVDDNTKPSGIFFYINYLLTLFPFAILVFYSIYYDYKNKIQNNWKQLFIHLWFLIPLILISFFKTKLEPYAFLFLPAFTIITASFILNNHWSEKDRRNIFILLLFNIFWFFLGDYKRSFLSLITINLLISIPIILIIALCIYLLTKKDKINFDKLISPYTLTAFTLLFFIFNNIFLFFNPPAFENSFKLSNIKNYLDEKNVSEFIYVSPNYKYNPQLSYYFNGVDMNWNRGYKWNLVELNENPLLAKAKLDSLKNNYDYIIIEKDNINRGTYFESTSFIPDGYRLLMKYHGYELWGSNIESDSRTHFIK
ncbi:MAG TPA: glycosyltransferase family 39 protein [Ignavibacteria bacterium]|nr:glycosyltransferase family 39 protein [Ignavibacteria bacterium]